MKPKEGDDRTVIGFNCSFGGDKVGDPNHKVETDALIAMRPSGGSESISGQGAKSSMASSTGHSGGLSSQAIQETAQHFSITGNEISAQAIMAGISFAKSETSRAVGESELGRYLPLA